MIYKPGLLVKNGERILVVDITVRYENRDYLLKPEKKKVDKYFPCLSHPREKYNVDDRETLPKHNPIVLTNIRQH